MRVLPASDSLDEQQHSDCDVYHCSDALRMRLAAPCDPPHARRFGYSLATMAFSSATKPQESAMAKADRNNLRRSGRDENRQQRREQPEVPGASGSGEDESAEAARMNALKRVGKTGKHSSDE